MTDQMILQLGDFLIVITCVTKLSNICPWAMTIENWVVASSFSCQSESDPDVFNTVINIKKQLLEGQYHNFPVFLFFIKRINFIHSASRRCKKITKKTASVRCQMTPRKNLRSLQNPKECQYYLQYIVCSKQKDSSKF